MSEKNISIEFLDRCQDITTRFEKLNSWNLQSQLLHVYEELAEVQNAIKNNDRANAYKEIGDVILSSITIFHKLGVDSVTIQHYMEETLQKAESRLKKGVY